MVGLSVGNAFVPRSRRRTLLAYLALNFYASFLFVTDQVQIVMKFVEESKNLLDISIRSSIRHEAKVHTNIYRTKTTISRLSRVRHIISQLDSYLGTLVS